MESQKKIVGETRHYLQSIRSHVHAHGHLILPLEGQFWVKTNHTEFDLNASHFLVIPPECPHSYYSSSDNKNIVLDIPAYLFTQQQINNNPDGFSRELDESWKALKLLLQREIGQISVSGTALFHLFSYAQHLLLQEIAPPSILYLKEHFQEPLCLDQLASIEGYSTTYYCDWFKKQMGCTPVEYLQKLRLQQAKKLLLNTDLSILNIALDVGYEQHSSLTRLFQQQEGVTPTGFRRHFRKSGKKYPKIG